MTKLETILRDARSLSPDDLAKLLAALMEQAATSSEGEEILAGQRGLASWTASTRDEDWSAHYPAELRNGESEDS